MLEEMHYEKEIDKAADTLADLLAMALAERHVSESATHAAEKEKNDNS